MKRTGVRLLAGLASVVFLVVLGAVMLLALAHAQWTSSRSSSGAVNSWTESGDFDGDDIPDSSDNCPAWTNPDQSLPLWPIPADDPDCDGFTAEREVYLGTDPNDQCADTLTQNDEGTPDVWPVDFNDDQRAAMQDVIFAFVTTLAPNGLNQDAVPPLNRVDFNGDTWINMQDVILGYVTRLAPTGLNTMCTPP